jgi:hypothetical protein
MLLARISPGATPPYGRRRGFRASCARQSWHGYCNKGGMNTTEMSFAKRQMIAVCLNAKVDGDKRGAHVATPTDKAAVEILESEGMVKVERTNGFCAGYIEWYVKLTAKGAKAAK